MPTPHPPHRGQLQQHAQPPHQPQPQPQLQQAPRTSAPSHQPRRNPSVAPVQPAPPLPLPPHGPPVPVGPGPSALTSTASNPHPERLVYPAIHLYPADHSFYPKQIALPPPQGGGESSKIRIGRQTNTKTAPSPTNGYFDSKVLSRMHAEIWRDHDQVWIRDIKSSNGTFLNGERLSVDGQESDAFELHSDDLVEFGIDIAGEDGSTILHHKVSCRVQLILTEQDALAAQGEAKPSPESLRTGRQPPVSFDMLLMRLQGELKSSREAGVAMQEARQGLVEAHHILAHGPDPPLPHAQPTHQHLVPPLHQKEKVDPHVVQDLLALQATLDAVQTALRAQSERMHALDATVAQQRQIEEDLADLRQALRETDEAEDDDGASIVSFSTVTGDTPLPPPKRPPPPQGAHKVHAFLERQVQDEEEENDKAEEQPSSPGRAPPDLPPHLRETCPGGAVVVRVSVEERIAALERAVASRASSLDLSARIAALEAAQQAAMAARREWEEEQELRWRRSTAQYASLLAHPSLSPASSDVDVETSTFNGTSTGATSPVPPPPVEQKPTVHWVAGAAVVGLFSWILLREHR